MSTPRWPRDPAPTETTPAPGTEVAVTRGARGQPLRAASYNIRHGVGIDNVLDLGRTARIIDDIGPDVIGLQEVDRRFGPRSNFVDQATWLAERLGLHAVFGVNLDFDPLDPGAPRRQFGNATLSRHEIKEWRNTLLPRPEGGEQRGLLEAVLEVRGRRVRVFNTHLQRNSRVERLAQVERIRAVLAESREPIVLLGDINARPGSPELAALTEDLVDAWVTAGEGDGFTLDSATPHARVDYVLGSEDVVAKAAAVIASDASDHLPVVADLAVQGWFSR
jgi:endonuclease/exonuclease/phosphatase family metal-dependent hydrolase